MFEMPSDDIKHYGLQHYHPSNPVVVIEGIVC